MNKQGEEATTVETHAKRDIGPSPLERTVVAGFADVREQVANLRARLLAWNFTLWLVTLAMIALLIEFLSGNPG
jgi:hypothetical protein